MRSIILRGAGGAGVVQLVGVGLAFALHIALARTLGTEAYGSYLYAITWVSVLAFVSKLGLDTAATRYVPIYLARRELPLLRGLLRRSTQIVFVTSCVIAVVAALAIGVFAAYLPRGLAPTLWLSCLLLPALAYAQWLQGALRGLRRVVQGELPDRVVRPAIMIGLVAVLPVITGSIPGATSAIAIHLGALIAAAALAGWWLRRGLPTDLPATASYAVRAWITTSLPLAAIGVVYLIMSQTDILIIGSMLGPTEVGIYGAAARVAGLVLFGSVAIDTILAPTVADLHVRSRHAGIRSMAAWTAWASFAFAATAALVLALLGRWVLAAFGHDMVAGYVALLILLAGYAVSAAVGSVSVLLMMTGHERPAAAILIASLLLNVALNVLLIPRIGIVGAALATAVTTITWRGAMAIVVARRLGIIPLPLRP